MGTVAPAGAEDPRVGNRPAICPFILLLWPLAWGLALPKQLPVFKVLIKQDCSGLILSLCLNAVAVCACLGALPWVPGLQASTPGMPGSILGSPQPLSSYSVAGTRPWPGPRGGPHADSP